MTLRLFYVVVFAAPLLALTPPAQAQQAGVRAESGGVAIGGNVSGSTIVIGITLEQYEAGLKKRAEEIRAEEAEKRVQLQKLLESTERATGGEKDGLRSQIAAIEAEKRRLGAEKEGVADRLANLQASYEGLAQKLNEANAALEAFAPLISKEAFDQAQAMLRRGDVPGAERKFVEIANTVAKIRAQADVVEARAIFQAGKLAEQRIDWRAAYAYYARAARLQPSNRQYTLAAGRLADSMGDYRAAVSYNEVALYLATAEFGPDTTETATALHNLAVTYLRLARYTEAESLFRRATEIDEKALGKDHPAVATDYGGLASLLKAQGKLAESEPLFRRAIEIDEKALGKDHPSVAADYSDLAGLLRAQGNFAEAEPLARRAMEIFEKVLGKDHPTVAVYSGNLALLLHYQRKFTEAEPFFRRAMEISEKAFGKDHPNVAINYTNFAGLLRSQGKLAEAESLYRRAIAILQTNLGPQHPTTLTAKISYDSLRELIDRKSDTTSR